MTNSNTHVFHTSRPGIDDALASPRFLTTEYLLAFETGDSEKFCRLHCGLCCAFVRRLKAPVEFRSLKYFFPFLRLASVLEFPRTQEHLPLWLQLAFQAGLELGDTHPEAADEILPDHVLERTRANLAAFMKLVDDRPPLAADLPDAFAHVAEVEWPHIDPLEMNQVYSESAVRALRSGYLAATLALTDPCLASFCAGLPRPTPDDTDLVHRAMRSACTFEWEAALIHRMEHPLLRLARQLHRHDASEQDRLLANVNGILLIASVMSEDEDPGALPGPTSSEDVDQPVNYRGRHLERMIQALNQQMPRPAVLHTSQP